MRTYDQFINGAWHRPASGEWLESIDPATAQPWCHIARGSAADADAAAHAAQGAFESGPWAQANAAQRAEMIVSFADILEQRWKELVAAEIRDNGKRIAEVRAQFAGLHGWFRHFADQAQKLAPYPLEK